MSHPYFDKLYILCDMNIRLLVTKRNWGTKMMKMIDNENIKSLKDYAKKVQSIVQAMNE